MATAPAARRRAFPRPPLRRPGPVATTVIALSLLTLASAFARTRELSAAYWIDEGLSWGIASHHFTSIPHVLRQDGSPPLYYLMLHIWMRLFGTSEEATHVLSLIPALATIPVGWWAARSLFSERAAWFTAALFAFNTYLTTYAQETRMYSWMVLFSLIATACFIHAFVFRRRRYLIGFAVSVALMLYTHNWALFFIAASLTALGVLVWKAEDRRPLIKDGLLAFGGAFVLFIPWLPNFIFQARHTGAPWSTPPSLHSLRVAVSMTVDGDRMAMPILLAGGAGIATMFARRRGLEREAATAGLVLFFGTLLWAFIGSQISPAWAYRYFAAFVGPLLLMAGVGLADAGRLGVVAGLLILAFWIPFGSIAHKSIDRHVMWTAAPYLKKGDLVIVGHPEQDAVVNYYAPKGLRWANEMGPVSDPRVMNWVDAMSRMKAATPQKNLEPLIRNMKPGQHVLLLRPIVGGTSGWTAPWTSLVRQRSADWARALAHDPRFKLTKRLPHLRADYHPKGLRALIFTRVTPG
ncbi:MAG TPA: glycosyltransferase family 39 protein [Thermoleophilaceae bacterium]